MGNEKLLTRDIYNNPTQIGEILINAVENRLLNGEKISDSNSPFIFSLEASASLAAGIIEWGSNQFPALYTPRAQSYSDLYKQISDYDKIEMFATPANTTMTLMFEKNQLLERAKLYPDADSQYYLIQIPKDSYITFGKYTFGIYHPINIMIAKHTHLASVTFDGSEDNPLHALPDTTVEFYETKVDLADLLMLKLPIYQFSTQTEVFDCSKASGLNQTITYTDQFYAIRIFHKKNNTWQELGIVYSETMYDPEKPTVIVKVLPDVNQCQLNVPQVYFENDLIGSKVRVEIYTTLGAIDIDISSLPSENIKFVVPSQMDNPKKDWVDALNKLETSEVIANHPVITGGTNGASFSTIKRRIQNRISTAGLLVAPGQLKSHYADLGFSLDNVKDTLEERIYVACGLLTDTKQIPIQVGMFTTEIPLRVPTHVTKHVVEEIDAITVLPTAIYRYDKALQRSFFISEEEQSVLDSLVASDKTALCLFLNDNIFTKSLYHIHIRTKNRTPYITNYDLSQPKIEKLKYVNENIRTSERMSILGYSVVHNGYTEATSEAPHKYTIQLVTTCSDGITELLNFNPENVKVLAVMQSTNMQLLQVAEYAGVNPSDSKQHIFHVNIYPNYKFNIKNELGINVLNQAPENVPGYFTNKNASDTYVPLTCQMNILFLANLPDVINQVLLSEADAVFASKYKQLGLQELTVNLGVNLHNKLYASTDLVYRRDLSSVYSDDNYIVQQDEYETYPENIYKRGSDGSFDIKVSQQNTGELRIKTPELTLVSNSIVGEVKSSAFVYEEGYVITNIELTKLHSKGEQILDGQGNPILKYKAGDIRVGIDGQPLIHPREIVLMSKLLHVGLNLYYSEASIEEMIQSITTRTNALYLTMSSSADRLLENTYVLFSPYTSLGTGKFLTDNKKIVEHDLAISLRFKCYVPEHILKETSLQRAIRAKAIEIIETMLSERRISVTEISNLIRTAYPIIKHIDIFGINGDINLQMLECIEETKQPVLKQELWLDEYKNIILNKAVLIQFVS